MLAPQEYWFNSEVGENIDLILRLVRILIIELQTVRENVLYLHTVVQQWWARDGPTPVLMINGQTIALRIGKGPGLTCCLHFSLWKFRGMKWISKTK